MQDNFERCSPTATYYHQARCIQRQSVWYPNENRHQRPIDWCRTEACRHAAPVSMHIIKHFSVVYAQVHAYNTMYLHMYVNVYIYTHVHTVGMICMYTCICIYTQHVHTYIQTGRQTSSCVRTNMYTHRTLCVYMYSDQGGITRVQVAAFSGMPLLQKERQDLSCSGAGRLQKSPPENGDTQKCPKATPASNEVPRGFPRL